MSSAQNHKTRPARNNSLQRMLELERRYMMERLQSTNTATPTKTTLPTAIPATSAKSGYAPAAHLTIQAHRPEILAHNRPGPRQGAKPPGPLQTTPGKQPPLTINTAVVNLTQPEVAKIENVEPTASNPNVPPPQERSSSKVVSFDIPPEEKEDRGSICQSPSWEAYDRRRKVKNVADKDPKKDSKKDLKKEPKKEPKEAKKEKQKEKEKQKQKQKELKEKQKEKAKEDKPRSLLTKTTKRLSKSPPMSSVNAIDNANRITRSLPTPPPDSSRPGSSSGPRSSSREDTSRVRSHSRSSSISSLFRRPFESRQPPVEDNQIVEAGFIGGIKLEMERHAALQKALDEQLKADKGDEADIHPALRAPNGTSSEAEASGPSSSKKAADAQRRAYPPITRMTSVSKARAIVMSPTSTEGATFDRWKAFVGIRPAARQNVLGAEGVASMNMGRPSAAKGLGSPLAQTQQASPMSQNAPFQGGSKDKRIISADARNHRKDKPNPTAIQTDLAADDAPQISPPMSLAGPLEPPPRSPKRNSLSSTTSVLNQGQTANHSPQCSSSSRFSTSNTSAKRPGSSQDDSGSADTSIDSPGHGSQEPNSGGVALDSSQEDAAAAQGLKMPTWNEIRSTVVQAISSNVSLGNVRLSQGSIRDDSEFTVRRLTGASAQTRSSSDEMSYEEFHSPSGPGTPDTSRPQSEKGAMPCFSDIEQRLASQGDARPGSRESRDTTKDLIGGVGIVSAQRSHPKANGGPAEPARMAVVNAATQVLHMPQGRAVAQIRVTSETGVTQEPSFLPKLKHQPLRPGASPSPSREKMSASQQPWPASYLEEARKATPLAPPPGLRSPSLAPRGPSSKGTPPASVRSNPSSLNMSGRLSPSGDPVAKMFVECCGCKYYHDMPSDLYEAMANPETVISPRSSASSSNNNFHASHGPESSVSRIDLAGLITMRVRCPWCNHEMSTKCCAGYAAMVYLKQKLH